MSRDAGSRTVVTLEPHAQVAQDAQEQRHSEPSEEGAALSAAIVGADPMTGSTLRTLLLQTGLVKGVQEWGAARYVEMRGAQDVPDVIFLYLSGENETDFALVQQALRLKPSAQVAACTANPQLSPEFLLSAMRAGIREFLQQPYDRTEIAKMMSRIHSERASASLRRRVTGKLLAVLGTKGGVGTSTVAVNLAVQLAGLPGKSAVLLDFSRPMGDVAALLDLKPRFYLRETLANVARLDASLLQGFLTTHRSGLQVLAGATQLADWNSESFTAIERIVELAQQSFDFVIMDIGSFYSVEWENILQASEVLVVSEADLPGLARLNRHLMALSELRVSSGLIKLVINRWHRQDEAALEKVEETMRVPVFTRLPNSFKQVNDAAVRGITVGSGDDPLSARFREMAARFAGEKERQERKKSRLGQLFSF